MKEDKAALQSQNISKLAQYEKRANLLILFINLYDCL